jgi:hypothetical protein
MQVFSIHCTVVQAISREVNRKQAKGLWSRITAEDSRRSDAESLANFKKLCNKTGGGDPPAQPEGTVKLPMSDVSKKGTESI